MKKFVSAFFVFVVLFSCLAAPATATAAYPVDFELNSQAALLVDLGTGDVVFEKNADERMEPASVTKIIVAILLIEKVPDLASVSITAPNYVFDLLLGTNSSLSGVQRGETLTAEQLLHSLLIPSGNDAAMVIADYLGEGSIDAFVEMMNQKAAELGCTNTHFANPHGLHDPEHYTTARDVYLMTKYAMELPIFMEVCKKTRYTIPPTNVRPKGTTLVTTNLMMDRVNGGDYYYKNVQGIKTGSTEEAGFCLVSTAFDAKKNDRYLCVALGAPLRDAAGTRNKNGAMLDTRALYEWAFSSLEYKTLVTADTPVKDIGVDYAWQKDSLLLVPGSDFSKTVPKEINPSSILLEPNDDVPERVEAPIQKGQVIGHATITYADMELGTIELVASEDIAESSMLRFWATVKGIFGSIWVKIGAVVLLLLVVFYIVVTILYNKKMKKRRKKAAARNRKKY